MTKKKDAAQEITDLVYDRAKGAGIPLRGLYAATLKRVRDLLGEVDDAAQVAVVALKALELDGENFVAWRSLSWGTYEYVRDLLEVPDGAWEFVLWLDLEEDPLLRDSIDYWLREWADARDVVNLRRMNHAREELSALRDREDALSLEV